MTTDWQILTALVQADGTWNIRSGAMIDGTHTVTAFVDDPAGNEGTDSQMLTIDTAEPMVMIAGGANDLTNDATPEISGTAGVVSGTIVTVTLADETLTGPVMGGSWSVTAAALSDGPHRVVMSVSDAAGNRATFTQTLTVDTVAPLVAIVGGATATTNDPDPTIVGTSSAAPGSTVTVTIAGQTLTTLVQANGTWNATPTTVAAGTWPVEASVPDPAGNVGRAGQLLTITVAGPGDTAAPVMTPTPTPSSTPTPLPGADVVVVPAPTPPPSATTGVAQVTVTGARRQRVRGLTLSIGTKVTAPAASHIRASVSASVRIKGVRKVIRLTSATASIVAGRSATLRVKPAGSRTAAAAAFRKIKSATRRGRVVTATITPKLVDAAGNRRVVRRTVKLTK